MATNRYSWERKEVKEMNRATRLAYGSLLLLLAAFWIYVVITYLWGAVLYLIGASALAGLVAALRSRRGRSEALGEAELVKADTVAPLPAQDVSNAALARRLKYKRLDEDRGKKVA